MNLLAHLWLAERSGTSAAGQILGDIIKGRLEHARLGDALERGVRLHRRIDSRCDAHRAHRALRQRFEPPLRRYAGIIVDIGFDYALARCWADFSDEPLPVFADRIAHRIEAEWPDHAPQTAPDAVAFARLLSSYTDTAGIERALRSVGQRLRRRNPLPEALPALLAQYPRFAADLPPLMNALEATVAQTLSPNCQLNGPSAVFRRA